MDFVQLKLWPGDPYADLGPEGAMEWRGLFYKEGALGRGGGVWVWESGVLEEGK